MFKRRAAASVTGFLASAGEQADRHREVLIVEGARQVGKTALVEQALAELPHVAVNLEENLRVRESFDQAKSFEEFEAVLKALLNFSPDPGAVLFIDEAQESLGLGGFVRFMKERWKGVSVVLSGSSMSRLFRDDVRVPVGRINRIKIYPLSFEEFLLATGRSGLFDLLENFDGVTFPAAAHRECLESFDAYLTLGGLPRVISTYLESGIDAARAWRRGIFLEQKEDFLRKSEVASKALFEAALKAVADHVGFTMAFTAIEAPQAKTVEILSQLKAWHLLQEVVQRSNNATSRTTYKRYLYDLGIAQDLRSMPFPPISVLETRNPVLRGNLGGILENAIALQLESDAITLGLEVTSWKKGTGNTPEVDFILRDQALVPIECKATLKATIRNFESVLSYLTLTDQKVGVLCSAAPFEVFGARGKTLINVPVYLMEIGRLRRAIHAVT